jgi:hypothetical protein
MLERKLVTTDWSRHVNLSIMAICTLDTRQVYNKMTYVDPKTEGRKTQKEFYGHLAADLIYNTYHHIGGRRQHSSPSDGSFDSSLVNHHTGNPRSGLDADPLQSGSRILSMVQKQETLFRGDVWCAGQKTNYQCSICLDESPDYCKAWLCHTRAGKRCFPAHMGYKHSNSPD